MEMTDEMGEEPQKAARGSRLGCLLLTGLSRLETAKTLTDLTAGNAIVTAENDTWIPEGMSKPQEAAVHRNTPAFPIINGKRAGLLDWWLAVTANANTPNWDIVSTCTIGQERGLILVEAKAHRNELSSSGKPEGSSANSIANHRHIKVAIEDANTNLNAVISGWKLNRDESYQLANRFAWSWKLASIGIPVVLIYLGFRNVSDINGRAFTTHAEWEDCVHTYADKYVPPTVWSKRLDIGGTPLIPLIGSCDLDVHA
jgi:hypothetical protein